MRTLAFAFVLALTLTPLASAQLPVPAPTPVYTVEITGAPGEFPTLAANGSAQAPFTVVLTLANVVCGAPVTIPVTLTATPSGGPSNMAVAVEPSVINMTIAQGPHGSAPAGQPATGTGDAAAVATITGNITANASAQVSLVASAAAPPSGPTGCQGAGTVGAAESAPVVVFANLTATPQPPAEEPPSEDTPGFGALAAILAVGVAIALRRKKA